MSRATEEIRKAITFTEAAIAEGPGSGPLRSLDGDKELRFYFNRASKALGYSAIGSADDRVRVLRHALELAQKDDARSH